MTQHDDERDALLRILVEASRGQMTDTEWSLARMEALTAQRAYADAILAAGFHRTPTITEEMIEAAGRAINREGWTCMGGEHEPGNYDDCEDCREVDDEIARAALTAALDPNQQEDE